MFTAVSILQRASILPRRFCNVMHIVLWAGAFPGLANSLRAGEHLSYKFANPSESVGTEGVVTISLSISSRDDGTSSATYSRRESIRETLTDVNVLGCQPADPSSWFTGLPARCTTDRLEAVPLVNWPYRRCESA